MFAYHSSRKYCIFYIFVRNKVRHTSDEPGGAESWAEAAADCNSSILLSLETWRNTPWSRRNNCTCFHAREEICGDGSFCTMVPRVLSPLSLTCNLLKLSVSYLSGKYVNQPLSYQHMVTVTESYPINCWPHFYFSHLACPLGNWCDQSW